MTFKEVKARLASAAAVFCKPGTERVLSLCRRLGMPQNRFRSVHVTGTNGKGSTSLMIASVLSASGYRTGQFASPYLVSPTECIRIDGAPISPRRFVRAAEKVFKAAEGMADAPTEFELLTVIAFLALAEAEIDVAVIEVCMGGKTDATNVIDAPALSVITGISLEHTAFLGDTVEKIAEQKAGIIKRGCPVLYGGTDGGAHDVIAAYARALAAPLYRTVPEECHLLSATCEGTVFSYRTSEKYSLPLLGLYQVKNAALALDALSLLQKEFPDIREKSIHEGFRALAWQGRFERLSLDPLIYFDGAHNPDGIAAAKESIAHYFPEGVILVGGILKDKDYPSVVELLAPHVKEAFTVTPKNPRALAAADYAAVFRAAGIPAAPARGVRSALALAEKRARESSLPILCIGSLYLYAAVKAAIGKQKNKRTFFACQHEIL